MWRTTITLSIVAALAATGFAQPAAEPKPAAEEQADPAAADRLLQRKVEEAMRTQKEAARAEMERAKAAIQQQRAAVEQQLRATKRAAALPGWAAQPRPTRKEKVAYLGVATMEVAPELAAQLKLSPGMGLVVNTVLPDSPAERAGVKQYDLITRLDDQILTNPEQLRVLVRMKKQSDDVKLAIIRQGAPTAVNVELGQQEVEVEIGGELGAAVGADDFQPRMVNVRKAPDGDLNLTFVPEVADVFVAGGGGGMAAANFAGKNQIVWSDGQHTLNMELEDGKAVQLTARLRDGREVFKGPVATDDQRKALPGEIADKLRKAEAGGPLRFGGAPNARLRGIVPAAGRARVLTSTEQDRLLVARVENGKAVHAFAFSHADGKTLFDGPVATEDERKALPPDLAKQLETLEKNQDAATEFGATGKL
jgi:hypothetical protein